MLKSLRQLWSAKEDRYAAAVPAGERVYAVGDIHGRLDLLLKLASAIEADNSARGRADSTVVLLGDLIDRGPDSAGVLSFVRRWQALRKLRVICGNHEEMFLRSFEDAGIFRNFLAYGGRETVLSFPVDAAAFHAAELEEAQALMGEAVPREDIAFIEGFEDYIEIGDYLFVHAGIRPGIPVHLQSQEAMRWIREPFLSFSGSHQHVVVHGHTITESPDFGHNRIGIDTGAYMSGRLTALVLEGDRRWLIETSDGEPGIATTTREV